MSSRPNLSANLLSPPNVDTFSPDRRIVAQQQHQIRLLNSTIPSTPTSGSHHHPYTSYHSQTTTALMRNHLLSPKSNRNHGGNPHTPLSNENINIINTQGLSPLAINALTSAQKDYTVTNNNNNNSNVYGLLPTATSPLTTSHLNKSAIHNDGQEKEITDDMIAIVHKARDIAKAKEEASKGTVIDFSTVVANDLRYVRLENQIKELHELHEKDRIQIMENTTVITNLQSSIETEKNAKISAEAQYKAAELNLSYQQTKVKELTDTVATKEQQLKENQDTIKDLETKIESIEAKLEVQKVLTNDAIEEKQGAIAAYKSLQETYQETRSKDQARHTAELEKARKDALSAVAAAELAGDEIIKVLKEDYETRIHTLTKDLHDTQISYADAKQQISNLQEDIDNKNTEITKYRAEIDELHTELRTQKELTHQYQTDLAVSQANHRSVTNELEDAQDDIKKLKETIEELKEDIELQQTKYTNLQKLMEKETTDLELIIINLRKDLHDMTGKWTAEKAAEEWAAKRAEEARNEARIARQRCEHAVERETKAIKEASLLTTISHELQALLDEERSRVKALTETIINITTSNEDLKLELEKVKTEASLATQTADQAYRELQEEFTIVSNDRDRYLERLGSSNISVRAAEEKAMVTQSEMEEKLKEMQLKMEATETNARETLRQMQSLTTIRVKELQSNVNELQGDIKNYQEKLSKKNKELESLKEKYDIEKSKGTKQSVMYDQQSKDQQNLINELQQTNTKLTNNIKELETKLKAAVPTVPIANLPPPTSVNISSLPPPPLPPPSSSK